MDNLFEVNQTVIKWLRQEILTPEEEIILERLMASEEGRKLVERFQDKEWVRKNVAYLQGTQDLSLWQTTIARLDQREDWRSKAPSPGVIPIYKAYRRQPWKYVVAALVIVLAGGAFYWSQLHRPVTAGLPGQTPVAKAGMPGGDKAVLTLADGRQIRLDSTSTGVIAAQGSVRISQQASGQLAYDKTLNEKPIAMVYNTLATPRSGQFSLTLADGTKVWLNNVSTLRYPVAFSGTRRQVELTGEAYFEVAKKPGMPFSVIVHHSAAGEDGGAVEVLGTAFNVMAYPDESSEQTTLVEGSVRFVRQGASQLLKTDEQSVVDARGAVTLKSHVDVGEVTAWKNGYFHFDHASLETTMRQLARWYDVDVEYKTAVTGQFFNGKIQRNLPLADVLKGLEGQQVHFQLEERKIIVLP